MHMESYDIFLRFSFIRIMENPLKRFHRIGLIIYIAFLTMEAVAMLSPCL